VPKAGLQPSNWLTVGFRSGANSLIDWGGGFLAQFLRRQPKIMEAKISTRLCGIAVGGMLALMAPAPAALASVIEPGACVGLGIESCPGLVTNFSTEGIFGQRILGDTNVETLATGTFTGVFREVRLIDGMTGGFDFLYQVQRTGGPGVGGDPIVTLSTGAYTGWITNVGYCSACSVGSAGQGNLISPLNGNPEIAPDFISRGPSGADIVFHLGAAGIGDSDESFVLVIKTNATRAFAGTSFVSDGARASVRSSAPTPVSVPEPTTLALLGMGLAGVVMLRRRSRS